MNFKYILLPFILLILPISSSSNNDKSSCKIKIINRHNRHVNLVVEIADTLKKRRIGLMYRKNLGQNTGMLFVYPAEKMLRFWMQNTYIPLSIAYINKNGIINEIYDMMSLDTSLYPSKKPAKFSLEVNMGWFKKNNITKGCKILLNGCLGK